MLDPIPVTPEEDEAFAALSETPEPLHGFRYDCVIIDEVYRISDDSIHRALCVEEGCARCAA